MTGTGLYRCATVLIFALRLMLSSRLALFERRTIGGSGLCWADSRAGRGIRPGAKRQIRSTRSNLFQVFGSMKCPAHQIDLSICRRSGVAIPKLRQ